MRLPRQSSAGLAYGQHCYAAAAVDYGQKWPTVHHKCGRMSTTKEADCPPQVWPNIHHKRGRLISTFSTALHTGILNIKILKNVVLHCAMMHCIKQCFTALDSVVLHYAELYCVHSALLHCTVVQNCTVAYEKLVIF